MNTMIYSSYTSFGFNDLFCYPRNIKLKNTVKLEITTEANERG